MARRRRHKQADKHHPKTTYHHQRDHFVSIAPAMLVRAFQPEYLAPARSIVDDLLDVYQPTPRARPGRNGFTLSPSQSPKAIKSDPNYSVPSMTDAGPIKACVQRHQRREVIHALNLAGKGSRARRRRRTAYSGVSC